MPTILVVKRLLPEQDDVREAEVPILLDVAIWREVMNSSYLDMHIR